MAAFLLSAWEAEGGPFVAQFKGPLSQYPKVTAYNLKLRETLAETIKRVAAEWAKTDSLSSWRTQSQNEGFYTIWRGKKLVHGQIYDIQQTCRAEEFAKLKDS